MRRLEKTVLVTEGGNKATKRVKQGVCRDYVDSHQVPLSLFKINLNCQYLLLKKDSLITLAESFKDNQNSLGQGKCFTPSYLLLKGYLKKSTLVGKKLERKARDIDAANFPSILFNILMFEHSVRLVITFHANVYATFPLLIHAPNKLHSFFGSS